MTTVEPAAIEGYYRSIDASVERLRRTVAGLTGDQARQDPGGDEWSAVKVLAHVAEMLPYWAHQAEDVVARDSPDAPFGRTHDDPVRIAAVEAEAHGDSAVLGARMREAADEAQRVLRGIPLTSWSRAGRHPRRGRLTVTELVEQFMVSHTEEHAAQAEAIAAAVVR